MRFKTASLQSAYAVERAYYQLYFLGEKIRVNRENLSLLADLAEAGRAQNEVGKVTLQDVLRAQIEQSRVETEHRQPGGLPRPAAGTVQSRPGPPEPISRRRRCPQRLESVPLDLTLG